MVKVLGGQRRSVRSVSPEPPAIEVTGPQTNNELRKLIVRRLKGPLPSFDPDRTSVLLLLAPEILEFVTDYFTLISLSRTCRTLYGVIQRRPALRDALFDAIERQTPEPTIPTYWHRNPTDTSICRFIQLENEYPWYWNQKGNYQDAERVKFDSLLAATDLVKCGGLDLRDILDAAALPCYECKKIKSRLEFFKHYQTDHQRLLGCEASRRKCIDCVFSTKIVEPEYSDEEDNWGWEQINPGNQEVLGDLRIYLIDMPKGIPGFRQHCQVCSTTHWARTRPRKAVEASRVCEDCYNKGLRAVSPSPRSRKKSATEEDKPQATQDLSVWIPDNAEAESTELYSPMSDRRALGLRFDLLPAA